MKKTMHTEGEIRSAAALLGQRGGLSSAEGRMRKMRFEQRSGRQESHRQTMGAVLR